MPLDDLEAIEMRNSELSHLHEALEEMGREGRFVPLASGFLKVLAERGIHPDRLQVPMSKTLGFRHPTLWGVLLTWSNANGFADTTLISHALARERGMPTEDLSSDPKELPLSVSPFVYLHKSGDWFLQLDLVESDLGYDLLRSLRDDGMRHYCAILIPVPGSRVPAAMSIAATEPFPPDLREHLEDLRQGMGLALYGAYHWSKARQIAAAYIGQNTGPRVLDGVIARGSSEVIPAGIMFCDVRGFTALTERAGFDILPIMNRLFEAVGDAADREGGEILKFIGDAMLIIFALEERTPMEVASAMMRTVQGALARTASISQELGEGLSVGFGCHLGDVIYGNVGTPKRLDFTVMGSAVNLASRLESLCKPLETAAVFSAALADHLHGLEPAGEHTLKGVSGPVPVWRMSSAPSDST